MTDFDSIVFNIIPVPKPRMTNVSKGSYFSPAAQKYWAFKDELTLLAKQAGYTVPYLLTVTFNLPMPKSWSKKKKLKMVGTYHQQKPDLKNLVAAFEDVLLPQDQKIHTYLLISKLWDWEGSIVVPKI